MAIEAESEVVKAIEELEKLRRNGIPSPPDA